MSHVSIASHVDLLLDRLAGTRDGPLRPSACEAYVSKARIEFSGFSFLHRGLSVSCLEQGEGEKESPHGTIRRERKKKSSYCFFLRALTILKFLLE